LAWRLLPALQRHRFLQHRVRDGLDKGGDDRPGAALRIENLFQKGTDLRRCNAASSSSGQGKVSGSNSV